jgi:hypothetical protein
MKGSARAGSVITAPAKAEERLLKVCAGVADKKNCAYPFIKQSFFTPVRMPAPERSL